MCMGLICWLILVMMTGPLAGEPSAARMPALPTFFGALALSWSCWLTFFRVDGYVGRKLLICLLVTIWGLRLSIHIARRNYGQPEDRRYKAWRAEHGKDFWWVSFFTVFGIQGVLLWLISLVTQAGQLSRIPDRMVWLDMLGLLLWLVGFFFEAVGDWQLSRFRSDPQNRGRVMQTGLWAYSRHPNYFGETLIWWGLFLITLSTPMSLWTILSPITITFLLLKVSGVTLLEKTMVDSRPEYREYIETHKRFYSLVFQKGKIMSLITFAERGLIPDQLIRWGIRRLDRKRLEMEETGDLEGHREAQRRFINEMGRGPIAVDIDKPKEQHYELPPEFFRRVLGQRMKYSGCYWPEGISHLDGAEEAMLALTCKRCRITDGMKILELGCGWGALSLWLAEKYPQSLIHAVSNSASQRHFIEALSRERGINNLTVKTADMNEFDPQHQYDRIVSVEMFEHMRNWDRLLSRIATWLKPRRKTFYSHIYPPQICLCF